MAPRGNPNHYVVQFNPKEEIEIAGSMIGENQQLVINKPVEFEK